MTRPPPRSPLFPYTPLSRSRSSEPAPGNSVRRTAAPARRGRSRRRSLRRALPHRAARIGRVLLGPVFEELRQFGIVRSEEHTSELQSPCNLVCRLLLEKKKN